MENSELKQGTHIIACHGKESILVMRVDIPDVTEVVWMTMHGDFIYEGDIKVIYTGSKV